MRIENIPPHLPFLDTLAALWLASTTDAPADGLILLPTRRAARALAEAFLRAADGRPLLLPRITAFGGIDETPLALAGALDLPPAVDPQLRLAVLSRMILAMHGAGGAPTSADRAWLLARDLAQLLDEAARAEIDLAAQLPGAAATGFAAHWELTLRFLAIVTDAWPRWLAESGLADVAVRQRALLDAQARAWQGAPPPHPVWIAGTTGAIPAVARLVASVGTMPDGRVLLPGLDRALPDAAWTRLPDSHPQAGIAALLAGLGLARGDVVEVPDSLSSPGGDRERVPPARVATLQRALLPAEALGEWQGETALDLSGIARLAPSDQQEEAAAIALVLRDAIERPGVRAALVTPDRALAGRVAAELLRTGVVADDSAGEPLAETPPAVFLRLLATTLAEGLSPVPLLALLKHPLAALGLSPPACRAAARALERACLRGPRPAPGMSGLRAAVARAKQAGAAAELVERFAVRLAPALDIAARGAAAPAAALAALIEAAEALAETHDASGAARLWAAEEGEALATLLDALLAALPALPPESPARLPGLLEAALQGVVVRSRRSLRGRGGVEHPRVFIWGLLEARLQSVEVVVLGGLAEGVWPPATDPGPWLSRTLRAAIGLPSPEVAVGQMAHDFVMAACGAPRVVPSCPNRRDGAPAVPARWLVRLDALLRGRGQVIPEHPAVAWARALDQPRGAARPVRPPQPRPPVALRPRRMRVSEIEEWLRDPYAIYARHVLRLRRLAALDEAIDAIDYGSVVHEGMHRFLEASGAGWTADAPARLEAALLAALDARGLRPALLAWWRPRLRRIAAWVAKTEISRRSDAPPTHIAAEVPGLLMLPGPAGPFALAARADRIERRADGRLAILDYKTGQPPKPEDVRRGHAPQLTLEAAMAVAGGFGADLAGEVAELTYWCMTGGTPPGACRAPIKSEDVAATTVMVRDNLISRIAAFDDPRQPYLSRPHPAEAPRFSDYGRLARVAEWAAAEERE